MRRHISTRALEPEGLLRILLKLLTTMMREGEKGKMRDHEKETGKMNDVFVKRQVNKMG